MVLVTGATGFVGSYLLVHLLDKGDRVRALYRNDAHINRTKWLFSYLGKTDLFDQIEWFCADITDIPAFEPAFESVKMVYHCAAVVSFEPKDELRLRKVNIEGTANVVNISLARGVSKLCFVSSIASLGDQPAHEIAIHEETEWNPEAYHSDYSITKYGAEMEVWRGQQEGLDAVIVNPGVILGIWPQNSGSMQIFHRVNNGLSWYTQGYAGFVGVDDTVGLMRMLMHSDIHGERFTIVAENIRFDHLVHDIATRLGARPPARLARPWQTKLAFKLDWLWSKLTGTRRKLPRAIAISVHSQEMYTSEKIMMRTGYTFRPMAHVIADVCRFLKKQV